MFPLLDSLKGLTKLNTLSIDNNIFRLHYKFTLSILALFSLVTTFRQFLGDPISCSVTGSNNAPKDMVDPFCWTHNTYSISDAFDKKVGDEVSYHGVGQVTEKNRHLKVEHKYYQWVSFVLAMQGIMFYLPRYMWKGLEGQKVKNLLLGLNMPTVEPEELKKKAGLLTRYMMTHRGLHQKYFFSFTMCEILNLVNVVGQWLLLNRFLGFQFTDFGTKVLQYAAKENSGHETDPMIRVFPRLTKCEFFNFGSGGTVQKLDILCVLPLNIINEKIFIFIWFWFLALMVVTSLGLIYRLVVLFMPHLRIMLLKARSPLSEAKDVDKVTSGVPLGDWFILYQLSKNIESMNMCEVLKSIADEMDGKGWFPDRIAKEDFGYTKTGLVV